MQPKAANTSILETIDNHHYETLRLGPFSQTKLLRIEDRAVIYNRSCPIRTIMQGNQTGRQTRKLTLLVVSFLLISTAGVGCWYSYTGA